MWVAITFGDVREPVDVFGPFNNETDALIWLENEGFTEEDSGVYLVTPKESKS